MMRDSTYFDIAGVVAVELVNASEPEIEAVARQVGLPQNCLRRPDITVEFVPRFDLARAKIVEPGRYVVTHNNEFLVCGGSTGFYTAIDFQNLGRHSHLRCERGATSVPHLISIVALTALARGYAPLHASAFRHNGKGFLVSGWSKAGKTEAMLAFATRGAQYVGDEWILLSPDGEDVFGVPEQIRVWDFQISQARQLGLKLEAISQNPFFILKAALSTLRALRSIVRGRMRRRLDQIQELLARQTNLQLPPAAIFRRSATGFRSTLDHIAILVPHLSPRTEINEIALDTAVHHLASSVRFELMRLLGAYLAFKYAFPGIRNPFLEDFEQSERALLVRALHGRQVLQILHPYPVRLEALLRAIESITSAPTRPIESVSSATTEAECLLPTHM